MNPHPADPGPARQTIRVHIGALVLDRPGAIPTRELEEALQQALAGRVPAARSDAPDTHGVVLRTTCVPASGTSLAAAVGEGLARTITRAIGTAQPPTTSCRNEP